MENNPKSPEDRVLFYLERLSHLTDRLCRSASMALMVAIALVAVAQVIGRYFLGFSFSWAEEFMRYGFIWMTMLGAAILVKSRGHAVIDVFTNRLSGWPRRLHEIFVYSLIAFGMIVLLLKGIELVNAVSSQKSPALRISMSYPYSALPLASAFMVMHCMLAMYRAIWHPSSASVDKE